MTRVGEVLVTLVADLLPGMEHSSLVDGDVRGTGESHPATAAALWRAPLLTA